jgi:hypothetical protein
MFTVLAHEEKMYDTYYAGNKIEIPVEDSYSHTGTLGYNAMVFQQGLHFNMLTHELVGVEKDALDLDFIVHTFNEATSSGREGEEPPSSEEVELRARHYLVFFFQLWYGKAAPVEF